MPLPPLAAASFFTEVRAGRPGRRRLRRRPSSACSHGRGVITDDIERVPGGESFFWRGHYEYDLNVAHTDDTQLGVFGDFEPKLVRGLARRRRRSSSPTSSPTCSAQVRGAVRRRALRRALDSMNLWIETARDSLLAAIAEVDCADPQRRRDPPADRRVQPRRGARAR